MYTQRRVSSRLLKNERNKMMRQIFWFGGLAVVMILGFIFIVLPLFIRFVNAVLNTNPVSDGDEAVILQPPAISAPVDATHSAQFKISGYDQPEREVAVVVNGQEFKRIPTTQDGSFETDVELTEGENTITAFSVDKDGNESKTGQTYTVVLDSEKPKLEISEPADGAKVTSKEKLVTVAGSTDPDIKVYVNGRFYYSAADGSFSIRHALSDGDNEITVSAVDDAGNETTQSLKVSYAP